MKQFYKLEIVQSQALLFTNNFISQIILTFYSSIFQILHNIYIYIYYLGAAVTY